MGHSPIHETLDLAQGGGLQWSSPSKQVLAKLALAPRTCSKQASARKEANQAMIDPALLADIQGSKNPVLQRVCDLVRAYNTKPQTAGNPQANQEAIKLLDKVMKHAARYMTSKPPNAKDKNKRKWDALTG